jgi:hypothetical protein
MAQWGAVLVDLDALLATVESSVMSQAAGFKIRLPLVG